MRPARPVHPQNPPAGRSNGAWSRAEFKIQGLTPNKERQLGNLTGTAPNYTGIDNLKQDEDWCYDATGNWQKYGNADESLLQTRTHNAANEITSVANPTGVIQPAYDKVGNQTADIAPGDWDKRFDLKWDAWNRLVQVKHGTTVVQTIAYDGLTRRITSTDAAGTVHYYYDRSWRAVEEYLDSGSAPVRRYLWGLRSRWDLAKRERDDSGSLDEKRYVLYDAMDPVAVCDGSGNITQRFEYSPFGETSFMEPDFSPDAAPGDWNWLFHGEFRDVATGYYNYGYRYYNPTTGRWISRDPIGERGGLNLYATTRNGLIQSYDMLGLINNNDRLRRFPGMEPKPERPDWWPKQWKWPPWPTEGEDFPLRHLPDPEEEKEPRKIPPPPPMDIDPGPMEESPDLPPIGPEEPPHLDPLDFPDPENPFFNWPLYPEKIPTPIPIDPPPPFPGNGPLYPRKIPVTRLYYYSFEASNCRKDCRKIYKCY